MGRNTAIAWCRSSWSPWIGCTEVSPGCDHCYAREQDARYRYGGATHWGVGVPRHRTAAAYWRQPLRWNEQARKEAETGQLTPGTKGWTRPGFWPVFPSMCDPFDNEVPQAWRTEFFRLIAKTPNLTWLLLTKRIGNAAKMLYTMLVDAPPLPHVWLGASVVNQEEADRDIPKLLATPAAKRFVSYEPALGPVDFTRISLGKSPMRVANSGSYEQQFRETEFTINALKGAKSLNWPRLDQIIVGGESNQGKHRARPFDIAWARSTVAQCKAAGVACFVKQMGSNAVYRPIPEMNLHRIPLPDRSGADPAEWPEDLRVQEWPHA